MAGSRVEKVYAGINSVKQGMFIRSSDAAHPVLLYLHGGPGMPTYFLNRKQPTGLAVTDYLRGRFGKEKIYLMGHSWGSFIGIQAAAQAPERYGTYIGVAQMTNQLASEALAYAHMLQLARVSGNTRLLRKLEATPPTTTAPLPGAYMALRDEAMPSLGGGHDA